MKYFILLSVVLLTLSGCISERKRADIFHRYAREHRAEVLEYCPAPETKYVKGKPDTVTVTDTLPPVRVPVPVPGTTDTLYADCPPSEKINNYINQTDTAFQVLTAELEAALLREQKERETRVAAEAERDVFQSQARNRLWMFIASIVANIILAFLLIRGKLSISGTVKNLLRK